ncbi:MAG: efflux RND transporter permease subunit, partial [Gammaproteobacteria bacterium]|nr:efflux RND transporter permease subunit [Gammaproteobacteria bacterium]
VEKRLVDRSSFVITQSSAAMAVNAHREIGVNVLEVMEGLRQARDELAEGPLKRAQLSIEQVYDETQYIDRSIAMLQGNLALGILLAIGVLWWFLRRFRATLIVAISIPMCLMAAFFVLDAGGSTLNAISLAGLAFAVGMVLDASIVVLENIVRLRERGSSEDEAALQGPSQVWGALLASTATTVAIFMPVVFLEDEVGQLFGDLALTIAVAVTASLIVAITVIPTAARKYLTGEKQEDRHAHWWHAITTKIMAVTDGTTHRHRLIAAMLIVPLLLTYFLIPKADYLPEGNRNLVFAFILPPPGVNIDVIEKEMGQVIAERMRPYLAGEKEPHIKHYFFVAFPQGVFMGTRTVDPADAGKMVGVINQAIRGFPDTLAFARRASLFGGFGSGRTINVDIQGSDLEALLQAGMAGFGSLHQAFAPHGGAQVRPFPNLQLAEPELRLEPNERRIAEAGWNRATMAQISRTLGSGMYVGDYFDGEKSLDIIARVEPWATPEQLEAVPLATPNAGILPVSELMNVVRTAGPNEIRRLDKRRTVTLQVKPPENMSLEEAMSIIKTQVIPAVENLLPEDGAIRYSGTADKLQTALTSMGGSFLLAIIILYLLMSALFRSFVDSLLVLLALPLATVGSVI